jgi:DNA polymerase
VSTNWQPALSDLLRYLDGIGYGDVYLKPAAPRRVEPEPVHAAAPAGPVSIADDLVEAAPRPVTPPPVLVPSIPAVAPVISAAAADIAGRVEQLAALGQSVEGCTRCRLAEGRHKVVFGSGNPRADLMFIGEGPGAEEDRQGLPFVGAAGELLTRMIQAIEMTRQDVYIANVVKCRPPGNRDPQPDEIAACRGYLERQIALVQPKLIVALGKIAAQTLLGNESPVGRMRGQWHQLGGIPMMVTYHPAALLHNPALKRPTWEDLQLVRDRLRGV